jgi:hypothetical protein
MAGPAHTLAAAATSTPCPAAQAPADGPTMEQLGLAYRHLWRPGWPATLEGALQRRSYLVAITQVARNLRRRHPVAHPVHSLPRPPAPPTPAGISSHRYGRGEYSIATGPQTDLGSWKRLSPKAMMSMPLFDAKRAAANDRDD